MAAKNSDTAKQDALDMKAVSDIAKRFVIELNGEQEQLQIEEVILSPDRKLWLVTVSYLQLINNPNQLQQALNLLSRRVYKRLTIDSKSLRVVGMQNWTLVPQAA